MFRGSSGRWGKLAVALLVLFGLSMGAGYAVGATVNPDDGGDVAAPATSAAPTTNEPATTATTETATTPVPTTVAPTTRAPTTVAPTSIAPTTIAPTTTTTTGPQARIPDRDHPLRIALAGDSVMAGLSPPIKAALEADGTATVKFILTPSILRDPAVRFTWNTQLDEFDPEVIVMFVGTWEGGVIEKNAGSSVTSDPNWQPAYERDILDPWIQLITSRGANVIWIGNPIVKSDEATSVFAALNGAFMELPTRWPAVSYLESNPALNGSQPGYHDIVSLADGTRIRTRQLDGLHLCSGGAALLGRVLLAELADGYHVSVAPGWENRSWTTEGVYPPASCPAP